MRGDSLAEAIQHLPAGWRGEYFEVVESTQDLARIAARQGAPDRSIFVADLQRAGRGRHGRTWLAAAGQALLMSIVFREPAETARAWRFTTLASLALVRASMRWQPQEAVAIKWPNDVMLGDCKVAGVLAETTSHGRELIAIVGVGVNVSGTPRVDGAACLGSAVDRGDFLLAFASELDALRTRPSEDLHREWASQLWRRQQRVHLLDMDREEEVVILGADPDGALRVRDLNGNERTTMTAEVLA